jgi:signal transduction histidine kinase
MTWFVRQHVNTCAWILVFAVFVLQIKAHGEANINLLYVVVLLVGLWTPGVWDVLYLAGLATGFSAIAYANTQAAWDPSVTMWNHAVEIVVVWITAFGVNLHRRTLLQRERAERHAREAEAKLREQAALAQVGKMATIVCHEVRNPLAAIRGAIQMIGKRLDSGGRERAILQDVIARVDALNAQLTDLLNFARSSGSPDDWWNRVDSPTAREVPQRREAR